MAKMMNRVLRAGPLMQANVSVFQLLCFFFLTPDTRHLKPPAVRNLSQQIHLTLTSP